MQRRGIYKPTPGEIRSGDLIGLYYPLQPGNWLSCQGFECKKETCPGHSSIHYGFETIENWLRYYKNVYKIFTFKKGIGAPLYSGDNVMFYLVNTKTWLNGEGWVEGNNQCPESAPPRRYKFDECSHEIFTVIQDTYVTIYYNSMKLINRSGSRISNRGGSICSNARKVHVKNFEATPTLSKTRPFRAYSPVIRASLQQLPICRSQILPW